MREKELGNADSIGPIEGWSRGEVKTCDAGYSLSDLDSYDAVAIPLRENSLVGVSKRRTGMILTGFLPATILMLAQPPVAPAWTSLLADVRANHGLDPASAPAQELARRWDELTERTMRGYQQAPELKEAIAENYKQSKFEGIDRAPQAADFAFIEKVKAARKAI
jgi:hypothetical protein